jgi:hypothetical protein
MLRSGGNIKRESMGKYMEGSDHGLISCIIPTSARGDLRKLRNISLRTVGLKDCVLKSEIPEYEKRLLPIQLRRKVKPILKERGVKVSLIGSIWLTLHSNIRVL